MRNLLIFCLLFSPSAFSQAKDTWRDTVEIYTNLTKIRNNVYDVYITVLPPTSSCIYGKEPRVNSAWMHHEPTKIFVLGSIDHIGDQRIVEGKRTRLKNSAINWIDNAYYDGMTLKRRIRIIDKKAKDITVLVSYQEFGKSPNVKKIKIEFIQ